MTARMSEYVDRERQLVNNPKASVARSQLSIAATQASYATQQMHYQEQSLQSSLKTNVKPIADEQATIEQRCRESGPTPSCLTPAEIESRNAACGRLLSAAALFRQKYNAVSASLAHLEQIYLQENKTQQGLLQVAQRLQ